MSRSRRRGLAIASRPVQTDLGANPREARVAANLDASRTCRRFSNTPQPTAPSIEDGRIAPHRKANHVNLVPRGLDFHSAQHRHCGLRAHQERAIEGEGGPLSPSRRVAVCFTRVRLRDLVLSRTHFIHFYSPPCQVLDVPAPASSHQPRGASVTSSDAHPGGAGARVSYRVHRASCNVASANVGSNSAKCVCEFRRAARPPFVRCASAHLQKARASPPRTRSIRDASSHPAACRDAAPSLSPLSPVHPLCRAPPAPVWCACVACCSQWSAPLHERCRPARGLLPRVLIRPQGRAR